MDLKIILQPLKTETIVSVYDEDNLQVNNISSTQRLTTSGLSGGRGFVLSAADINESLLDDNNVLFGSDGYPGIMSTGTTGGHGNIDFCVYFQFSGLLPNYLYVGFDSVLGEYATDFDLGNLTKGKSIYIRNNKKVLQRVDIDSILGSEDHVYYIRIHQWSKANTQVKLSMLGVCPQLVFNTRDIKNAEWSESAFADDVELSPGICEQYAELELYDRTGILTDLAKSALLTDSYEILISVNDDIVNTYAIRDWDVDTDNSLFSLKGADYYYQFSNIKIEPQSVADRTVKDMLDFAFDAAQKPYQWFSGSTHKPSDIHTPNSWFAASTVGEFLEKVCNAFALRIYWIKDAYYIREVW